MPPNPPAPRKNDPVALAAPLIEKAEYEKAAEILRKGVYQHPRDVAVYGALCHVLEKLVQIPQMEFFAREGLKVAPRHVGLTVVLGKALRLFRKLEEARKLLEEATVHNHASVELAMELGEVYIDSYCWIEVVEMVDRAIKEGWAADPMLRMRATVLHKLGRLDEAVAFIRQAQWSSGTGTDPAMVVATLLNYDAGSTAEQVAAAHRRYGMLMNDHFGEQRRKHAPCTGPDRPLRIGVISPDLRQHSVVYFATPLFAALRALGHTVFAYYSGFGVDDWTRRIMKQVHHFRPLGGVNVLAIADQIASDKIDMLFELSGLTTAHPQTLMAIKPAPVQVSYIGYPSTTGLETNDFRIVDSLTDPVGAHADSLCTERLIRMDPCFLCYQPPAEHLPPIRQGLPPTDRPLTFGSFNTLHKVNDFTLRLWARVMEVVPGSRLAVKMTRSGSQRTTDAVIARFVNAGIDRDRIVWMGHTDGTREHLATYDSIDVALDTYPYHGTTTTIEAMIMGVPVVSLIGDRHAARVGLSLLSAAGLDDLAATDEASFVRIAAELAGDGARLASLRANLRDQVLKSPLGDQAAYAIRLGKAVREMWTIACKRS